MAMTSEPQARNSETATSRRRLSYPYVSGAIRNIPGSLGIRIRAAYYASVLKHCGASPLILEEVFFDHPECISIGGRVRINRFSTLQGAGGIDIGNDVLIGPMSLLESVEHTHSDEEASISSQGYLKSPIVIEDDVWIGAGAIVLSGIRIGRGSIVGAGAVVTSSVPSRQIVAGVPARSIGVR